MPRKRHYTTKEVANVLGISTDLLRWRIKTRRDKAADELQWWGDSWLKNIEYRKTSNETTLST